MERIQKVIANSGFCSRRKAEELIEKGVVTVNGKVISKGFKVDKEKDKIIVFDKPIKSSSKSYYYILNKPKGILVTKKDPKGRKTIYDLNSLKELKKKIKQNLNYVGRLDGLSEGLLILTNDGDLTNLLTRPRYHAKKTYEVRTEPRLSFSDKEKLEEGILIDERKFFSEISNQKGNVFHITIKEGRNRIIRRSLDKLGYKIFKLKRLSIENIKLDNLNEGQIKELDKEVIEKLKERLC